MLYREAGQYKTSYAADMAVFPILQDRIGIAVILAVAFVLIPATGNAFLLNAIMIPFLIFSLAAIGLNLLTGYTGLLSLGTGAFMGVGAYACYKLTTIFPNVSIIITGPRASAETRYLIVLTIVAIMTWMASNIVHGRIGRMWMAVRDMDIA